LSEYEVALLLVGPDTRIIAEFELYQTDVSFCSRMLSLGNFRKGWKERSMDRGPTVVSLRFWHYTG